MTKFGVLFSGVLASAFLLLGSVSPVFAATQSKGVSLTTSPVSAVLTTQPGTSTGTTLQVMNNTTIPLNITLQLQTFRANGTSGQAQIIPAKSTDQFIKWVTFSKNSFVAQPGVWVPIQMTINVPSYAALGYYYAVLVKPTFPVTAKTTERYKSSNAILILLNAQSDKAKAQLQLVSFSTTKSIYEYLPATFQVNIHNSGNIFLAPTGNIFISNSSDFKNIIGTINVNQAEGNILPGSNRIYSSQWADGFPVFTKKTLGNQTITDKSGADVYQLKWNFAQNNKFRFGKYYAKVVIAYNNGVRDVPLTAVVSFWIIPWKMIILLLLFILLIAGLIFMAFYFKHKAKKKTKWRA